MLQNPYIINKSKAYAPFYCQTFIWITLTHFLQENKIMNPIPSRIFFKYLNFPL